MSDPISPENSGSEKKPRRPARKKAAKKKAQPKGKAGAAESPFDLPTAPEEAEFTIIGGAFIPCSGPRQKGIQEVSYNVMSTL